MIKIKVQKNDKLINLIEVSGHANAGEYGNDLVCAAITGIVSGALNALDKCHKKDVYLEVLENKISIQNKNLNNQNLQIMLNMLIIQLETIWMQYKKNIEIKEVY